MQALLIGIGLSLVPVVAFLLALVFLDSYKLVPLRSVLLAVVGGMVVAGLGYLIAQWLLPIWPWSAKSYTRYPAPLYEEVGKASICIYLIFRNRIGFMVDAAIFGFAVGTGFAVVENIYYLVVARDASTLVWIVRGFGTALMHGGVTAIFCVVAKTLHDLKPESRIAVFLPGLLLAFAIHSIYNHFWLPPGPSTLAVLLVLPPLFGLIFQKSEEATQRWLGVGFDTDQELLQLVLAGGISETRVGRYLHSLETRFPALVVADMLCWLRIQLELAIQAKGLLLMRQAGFEIEVSEDVKAKLEELEYLEDAIGRTGVVAVSPFVHTSRKDLWQLRLLSKG